MRQKL